MNRSAVWWAVLLSLCLSSKAMAQAVSEWTSAGSGVLGEPGVLVVVDSLDAQLKTEGGHRTLSLVTEAGVLDARGRVVASWGELSAALGIEPRAAVDRLLGERVVLAVPRVGLPMSPDWVLATRVARDDAVRVLKGLGAVHRGVLAGEAVFQFERGQYRLSVLKAEGDRRVLVLGPGEGNGLFEDAVRGLASGRGAAWFASAWPIEERGGVLVRYAGTGEASLAYAHATGSGWAGVVLASSDLPADTPTWSLEAESMIAGASLGMVGSMNADAVAGSPLAPFLGLNRAAAESVLGDASRRGVLHVSTDADGLGHVTLALETAPGRAVEVDSVMRMVIAVVTGRPGESPDFAGRLPEAARSVPLRGGFSDRVGKLVLGDSPRVRWQLAPKGEESGLLAVSAGSRLMRDERLGAGLSGLAGVEPGPLVSAGRLDPGPVAALIERAAGAERPVLGWADRVQAVTWRTRRSGEDRVKAEFEIVLRPAR